jgi:pilus assembly protein CpaB
VPVAAGSYVTLALLRGAGRGEGGPLRTGERALEIGVSGGAALTGAGPRSRVDVVVSTRRHEGTGRSFVALENVELLGLRAAGGPGFAPGESGEAPSDTAFATLRVSVRQAVYLTAAENFGHEVRLLVRPPGDRRQGAGFAVGEADL